MPLNKQFIVSVLSKEVQENGSPCGIQKIRPDLYGPFDSPQEAVKFAAATLTGTQEATEVVGGHIQVFSFEILEVVNMPSADEIRKSLRAAK